VSLSDAERGSIGRHRAHPEIGVCPQHGVAPRRLDLIDNAYQAFRRDDRTQSADACARPGAQNDSGFVAYSPAVQRLGGDESPTEA